MKLVTTVFLSVVFVSSAVFANCNPGENKLMAAAKSLAKINTPSAKITVKLEEEKVGSDFLVSVDDTYGFYKTIIKTETTQNGLCRIKSVTEM